jgi:thymidylate synthase (FAD)
MAEDQRKYDRLTEILKQKHTVSFIKEGKDEKTASRLAEKKAIEDARFVLPNACETQMIMTMNARSLHNFFKHRCCNRAQWEIKDVADQMLSLVLKVAPELFKNAGPACVRGGCPEGKMTCGKYKEIKEFYEGLNSNG